jgi:hypothetical protein
VTRRLRAGAGIIAVLAAMWVGLGAPSVLAAGSCITIGYVAALDASAAALRATPPDSAAAQSQLTALVDADPTLHAVLDPMLADLSQSPPDSSDALQRLDALRTPLALPAGSTCHVDTRVAKRLLDDIYASPVFANLDQNPQPGFLDRIGQALTWLFSHLRGALGVPGSIALGAVVLGLALALAGWRLAGLLGAAPARVVADPADAGLDADAEWKLALAAAQRGEHREAIRRAFRSALIDASDRGRVHAESAWTTRQMLASASRDPAMLAALAPAAAAFDYAWYSGRPSDARDWESAKRQCEAVRSLARKPPAAEVA